MNDDEQPALPAPGDEHESAFRFCGKIVFKVVTKEGIEVVQHYLNAAANPVDTPRAHTLGEILSYEFGKRLIFCVLRETFGQFVRNSPTIQNIVTGCLQFELCYSTEDSFNKILGDYETGKIKERLGEELLEVGIKTKGLEVKIQNREKVERTKTAILEKRYVGIH